ncbi:polyprenyl synthetase family protein [Paramicrobacterium sp. CJ85]|uniref:polyprenyl synthetase family protein n=1 Tax=Paramicrobacterium sp. CJ85 TaxID=3445355 RepID=UPI003F6034ED
MSVTYTDDGELMAAPADVDSALGGVARRLDRFFDERRVTAREQGPSSLALWDALRDSATGGKKIRPRLVLNAHRLLSGVREDAACDVAVAVELLHTAFLVHDDVIDGDTRRRGRRNVIGQFHVDAQQRGASEAASRAWGEAAGILAGDLLIHAAQSMVGRLDLPSSIRVPLIDLFDESVMVTAAGELQDVGLTEGVLEASAVDVLAMAGRKTAHYSFRMPLRAGAILAGADAVVATQLDEFGHHAGIAFQLRDDLLGVWGRAEATGKSTSSDLRRATMTPLLAHALSTPVGEELRHALGLVDPRTFDAERARALLAASGARETMEQLIADHAAAARAVLERDLLPVELQRLLADTLRSARERSS